MSVPLAMHIADSTVKIGSPPRRRRGILLQAVHPHLAGGSILAELVAASAAASIFALLCVLCGAHMGGLSDEPPAHLPPSAWEPRWLGI